MLMLEAFKKKKKKKHIWALNQIGSRPAYPPNRGKRLMG